ncbi:DUF4340 domain-containing protein [Marinobacter koreensis]|uniref:DUF4340 domain-containing protein n=1 Tax=Marinobacter koreensis TaxID=335974 RepID=A0ABW0RMG6_9GAMM|nr:DUF4340 domain-containing protein [Marinobacter koreensis]MCK7546622.1 DUF4340 domain-containing protein [Marinobacter koreensis]
MNRSIKLLSIALVAQLILTGVVWSMQASGPVVSNDPLLPQAGKADQIVLIDPEDGQLTLTLKDDNWFLKAESKKADKAKNSKDTATADTPVKANKSKVEALVAQLSGLKRSFPVARTPDARDRFKVADDTYRRKVVLKQGDDTLATLFVGNSPSMGESNVRLADDDAIYRAALAEYQLGVTAANWKAPKPKPKPKAGADTKTDAKAADTKAAAPDASTKEPAKG